MTTGDTTFPDLKEWLDQTMPWLLADLSADMLQNPHAQLVEMMWKAKRENRASDVWDLINELEELANRTGETREKGQILLNCAKVAADLENLKSSLTYFQGAEGKYKGFSHQHAVVKWMMGCVHWAMKANVDAITAWQGAIVLFQGLRSNLQVATPIADWYDERIGRMQAALATAIELGKLPSCNLSTPPGQVPAQDVDADEESNDDRSYFEGDSLLWVSTQVSESIPAGGFGPTGFDPQPLGFLELSEVVIEEQPYEVVSVRGSSARRNLVDINSRWRYHTVCVTGTSMNAAKPIPIVDGDFVFIRVQPDAEDNDIVVVGILGLDSRATVKRLRRRNGKIQLIPETTDPAHSAIDWEKAYDVFDGQTQIIGVVEAIFKKKLS